MSARHLSLPGFVAGALLLATVALAASPIAKPNPAAARAAKQSEEITKRIDALLKDRLKPEPLPRVLPNPFIVISGGATTTRPDGAAAEGTGTETKNAALVVPPPEEIIPLSSSETLARYAATLKIGGMIQRSDQLQIVINNVPRKEGDIITVGPENAKVYLRIVRVTPGAITLRLNDAEQVMRY